MPRKKTAETKAPPAKAAALDHGTLPGLIGYQLRLAQIRVFRDFMRDASPHDVSPGLLGMLMLIEANPGLTQSALAVAVALDRSTMVGVIDRLEARGWVERRVTRNDRRAYQLILTAAGAVAVGELKNLVAAHEKRILSGLSQSETRVLHNLLTRVAAN